MTSPRLSPGDPSSFSRPGILLTTLLSLSFYHAYYLKMPVIIDEVRVTHMAIELEVSFENKTLSGFVTLSVEKVNHGTNVLVSSLLFARWSTLSALLNNYIFFIQ